MTTATKLLVLQLLMVGVGWYLIVRGQATVAILAFILSLMVDVEVMRRRKS